MTYMPVRPYRVDVMGPYLYGLSGGCGCGGARSSSLSGGCGCGGSNGSTLGAGPLTNYLCPPGADAKARVKEGNQTAMIVGLSTGTVAGLLSGIMKSPVLGLVSGALIGYVVYVTQKLPEQ